MYCHALNTKTGYPIKSDLKSITIVSDESIDGDILSTSLFIMEKDKAYKFMKKHNISGIMVTNKNEIIVIKDLILVDTDSTYVILNAIGDCLFSFFPIFLGFTASKKFKLKDVGMDTVQLEGKYFNAKVKQGEKIKKGQLLLEFDINEINKAGFSTVTPVMVTNSDNYLDVLETDKKKTDYNEELLRVVV
ncbi:PTS glucose transporter subunit IIA [Clostridium cuniculi]|uniref:PTS glucose transporter subunit IIA n=1 Tax=Clostridium cuniculi TaxID=2548455 RepID=UPI001FAAB888|nr:PTS glucose transporter subunit IIA [Clostridium cuniculi]